MPLSEYQKQLALIRNGQAPKTTGAKPKKPINKVSPKKAAELKAEKEKSKIISVKQTITTFHVEKIVEDSVNQWFDYFMEVSEPVCTECGMRADWVKQPGYEKIWKACQAHILPKRKNYGFPSIASNKDNHIVLFPSWGGHLCGCHSFYDSGWYNATTMKIWSHVVETFVTKLYPVIPDKERKNIPEQLNRIINAN